MVWVPKSLIQVETVILLLPYALAPDCSNFSRVLVTQLHVTKSIGHHLAHNFLDLSAAFDTIDSLLFVETLPVLTF